MPIAAGELHAQTSPAPPYSATLSPAAPWGGYPVAKQVPHQPEPDFGRATATGGTAATEVPPPSSVWTPLPSAIASSPDASTAVGPPATAAIPGYPSRSTYDPAVRLAQAPSLDDQEPLLLSDQQQADSLLPPGTRDGVFQKANFNAAYLPQLEGDSLGITEMQGTLVFGLPFFTRETPLVIEPKYRVRFLDRPATPDLPPRLHDAEIEFRHFRRLNDRWIFDSAITLGVYADDHSFDASDAFRPTGRALFVYESSDAWKWILGVAYLNRAGASVVPVAGLAYHTDTVEYELVFPRPRAAWMLSGSIIDVDEKWVYLMAEFGGGAWAIQRPATGTPDTLTMRDYRLLVGYEHKVIGGLTQRYELGYVFDRELEFDSRAPPEVSLDDTLFIRAGFSY